MGANFVPTTTMVPFKVAPHASQIQLLLEQWRVCHQIAFANETFMEPRRVPVLRVLPIRNLLVALLKMKILLAASAVLVMSTPIDIFSRTAAMVAKIGCATTTTMGR
jgi:hypothetical protein